MSDKNVKVDPRVLKGFRDHGPSDMIERNRMIQIIRSVYESFGFVPIETPVLEHTDVLLGSYGDEGQKQIYRFTKGSTDMCMKFDLTVPLARFVAKNLQELPRIFKRYQIERVWRAEAAQKGRFREFYQCDVDIVGSNSMLSDAECVMVAKAVLEALKVQGFQVKVNNRKILNGLIEVAGVNPSYAGRTLQALDKLSKIGAEGVQTELTTETWEDGDQRPPMMDDHAADIILGFGDIKGTNQEILGQLADFFKEGSTGYEGVQELKEVIKYLECSGITEKTCQIDLSIARGLSYYTGTVFETFVSQLPGFGSIMSGGRFDGLVGRFIDQHVPAVGISLGLDRLYALLEELKLLGKKKTKTMVCMVNLEEETLPDLLCLANDLRDSGVNTEIFPSAEKMKRQLKYINKAGVPFALFYGSNEKAANIVKVKNMKTGEQEKVPFEKIIDYFTGLITHDGY